MLHFFLKIQESLLITIVILTVILREHISLRKLRLLFKRGF